MGYTLSDLAGDLHSLLDKSSAADCADKLCAAVSKALKDDEFVAEHLSDKASGGKPRRILYEDPKHGFCICAHNYEGQAIGKPHDHGDSWALYGQAQGVTEMTDWKIVEKGDGDKPSLVEPARTYRMERGDAHFYGIGFVHSPARTAPTKLIRIEGANLDHVKRSKIAAAASV